MGLYRTSVVLGLNQSLIVRRVGRIRILNRWTALLHWTGANLQVRSEPVTAVSSKGEHIVVVVFPRVSIHVPCLVVARIGKLGDRRNGSMGSHRIRGRITSVFGHVIR